MSKAGFLEKKSQKNVKNLPKIQNSHTWKCGLCLSEHSINKAYCIFFIDLGLECYEALSYNFFMQEFLFVQKDQCLNISQTKFNPTNDNSSQNKNFLLFKQSQNGQKTQQQKYNDSDFGYYNAWIQKVLLAE